MTAIKDLIQKWRDVKDEIVRAVEVRDAARNQLTAEDHDHVRTVTQWDEQKNGLTKAISEIRRSADEDRSRAEAALREADALMASAVEQRNRNAEHRARLTTHLQQLHAEAARIEERDAGTAQLLLSFRIERERTRQQLVAAIQKLEETLPAEREKTAQAIKAAGARTAEARHAMDADQRAWAQLLAKRRRAQHGAMVEAVEAEAAACNEGRQRAKLMRSQLQGTLAEDTQLLERIRRMRENLHNAMAVQAN